MKKVKRNYQFLISVISLCVFTCVLSFMGIFNWLENKAYDSQMKHSVKHFAPSEEIGLVLLDQESLNWAKEEFGWGWPWPRQSYAKIIDYFNRAGAASFAFDMIYSEDSVYGKADDESFAQSSADFGRVIQTVFYENANAEPTLPVLPIRQSAALLGNVSSCLDSDRIARRNPVEPSPNGEYGLSISSYIVKNGSIDLDEIPRAKNGGMYVRYVEDLTRFVPYSAKQILYSQLKIEHALEQLEPEKALLALENDADFIPPEQFEDMYIFFGLYTPGLFDICATPISETYPGVGVHLCQLDTILQKKYLRDTPLIITLIMLIIAAAGGFILGYSTKKSLWIKTLIAAVICFAYIEISYRLFILGLILKTVTVIFAFVFSYLTAIFEGYVLEGAQKRYLKSAFRQYLSPAVIENLIANPDMLNLGGEEREITAYFSDVQGFTSISENLSPHELTDLLNKYLSAMTDIILAHGGTIDKYEGDAIIAFWGAPTNQADHAKRAVEAALECQKKLSEMQYELVKIAGKPFVQRIGLNSGKAVVGNMGSRSRFDYTMMGDTVNLASRLEGINKQFGTYTMCSKATMERALANGCNCKFREIADIAVVGKKEGVKVYVPMSARQYEEHLAEHSIYEKAYSFFEEGNFAEAEKIFLENAERDAPSKKLAEKCDAFIKNPPEFWDGILHATEK